MKHVTTLTPEDLSNALADRVKLYSLGCSCLVYQAAKRLGLNPATCGLDDLRTTAGKLIRLDEAARAVTHAPAGDWPKFVGREIGLTE